MLAEPATQGHTAVLGRRDMMERLLALADHLAPAERTLVRCAYDWGAKSREIALLTGMRPRAVQRRLSGLTRRIKSPLFQQVLRLQSQWPEQRCAIARRVILHGWTHRRAARDLNLSVYRLRCELQSIRAECAALHRAGALPPPPALRRVRPPSGQWPRGDELAGEGPAS